MMLSMGMKSVQLGPLMKDHLKNPTKMGQKIKNKNSQELMVRKARFSFTHKLPEDK